MSLPTWDRPGGIRGANLGLPGREWDVLARGEAGLWNGHSPAGYE